MWSCWEPISSFRTNTSKNRFVVLVPDVICFKERRKFASVTIVLDNDMDFWNHLNEMCYRILNGDYLIKRILQDTMTSISLLSEIESVDINKIGLLGHSIGGNTTTFLMVIDERISFACVSGSTCSYKNRI